MEQSVRIRIILSGALDYLTAPRQDQDTLLVVANSPTFWPRPPRLRRPLLIFPLRDRLQSQQTQQFLRWCFSR